MPAAEEIARQNIDRQLAAAGWLAQDYRALNLAAGPGIAVREFPLSTGEADYLLYADGKVIAVVEAKPEGHIAEQAEIVAEVDRRLSVADAAETQVEHALQRAARLRQAILKRAFEGKLVPQDPTDEPAERLLEQACAGVGADTVTFTKATARKRGRTRASA
ncbi:Type-1 restriction enzyme EcoKI specificity protein [Phycisphaerales bacterium]|nr:Type-1 restriction enzyme EcoKI specificity protein [Phycisphaerales bacterium]